jgi:NADH-quinone oxidoreductase subunit N
VTIILPVFPEILLLALGVLILTLDPFLKKDSNRRLFLGWFTTIGLLVILTVSLIFARPSAPTLVFGGMLRFDWMGFLFKMFFLFAAAVTAIFFMDADHLNERAESYLLLVAATLGMCLMASASDLIMLYLAIETTSIPLYVLAGFLKDDDKSTESGFKYLLFGALTSAVLLYGFSLIYGFTGKTGLYDLSLYFNNFNLLSIGITFLVVAGLAFKVSLFPFHFWAPDVYEGAPTSVAGFLSTASKAAGFAVIVRLFTAAFPVMNADFSMVLAILATLTMTVGNLIALTQKNIKRMVAYSSIAHAGYAMIGAVAFSELGMAGVIFYLIAYVLTNLLAFGTIAIVGRVTGSDELTAYHGLSRRNPNLALAMLVAFLSLSGMPPFAGFVAKVFVFAAAVQSGWIWLAVVGVINSIVGLYYYLNILKYVYLYRMENQDENKHPVPVSRTASIALIVLVVGIILLGTVFGPLFGLATNAAAALF